MSEVEVELVAELLAKIGGTWNPDRARPTQGTVGNRHRDVAKLILAAVERSRVANEMTAGSGAGAAAPADGETLNDAEGNPLHVGAAVTYRPPGDKRTFACRIERIEYGRAYIVPAHREIGWVSTLTLVPLKRTRDNEAKRPASAGSPKESVDAASADEAASSSPDLQAPAAPLRIGNAPERVVHYFNSIGDWIAYSRYRGDQYLFDKRGNWIGWFPWDDKEIVDLNGEYLGVVMDGNRIYAKIPSNADKKKAKKKKRDVGFMVDPGSGGYAGYPGFTAHTLPPFGYKDVDLSKIAIVKRLWLKKDGGTETPEPSIFAAWMSKIGLGSMAGWIEDAMGLKRR
ncbi:hypothetical protein [Microvirga terricola]|uniref:WG containing repeat-containing protein n=1 Tax=Microvirga terricola TaxID=2719797 RepID=A0ABX0VE76_9HYPH|nr:hypothetical protein [Microvirga terricola]NIX77464.1 hypothetical protein [Microvirga terricola]